MDLSSYKSLYLKSAREYHGNLVANVPSLSENTPTDVLEILHRSAHSLKGQALVMGYKNVGQLSKTLEFLFKGIINHTVSVNSEITEFIKSATDQLAVSFASIEQSNSEPDLSVLIQKGESLLPSPSSPTA